MHLRVPAKHPVSLSVLKRTGKCFEKEERVASKNPGANKNNKKSVKIYKKGNPFFFENYENCLKNNPRMNAK